MRKTRRSFRVRNFRTLQSKLRRSIAKVKKHHALAVQRRKRVERVNKKIKKLQKILPKYKGKKGFKKVSKQLQLFKKQKKALSKAALIGLAVAGGAIAAYTGLVIYHLRKPREIYHEVDPIGQWVAAPVAIPAGILASRKLLQQRKKVYLKGLLKHKKYQKLIKKEHQKIKKLKS